MRSLTGAFTYCTNLKNINISGATNVGWSAFRYCNGLESVVLGGGIPWISNGLFEGCSNLTSITYNGTIEQWEKLSKGSSWRRDVPATEVVCLDGKVPL